MIPTTPKLRRTRKKILILTTLILCSTNLFCDDGYLDIYNDTAESINVSIKGVVNLLTIPGKTKQPVDLREDADKNAGRCGWPKDVEMVWWNKGNNDNAWFYDPKNDNKRFSVKLIRPNSIHIKEIYKNRSTCVIFDWVKRSDWSGRERTSVMSVD